MVLNIGNAKVQRVQYRLVAAWYASQRAGFIGCIDPLHWNHNGGL